MHIYTKSGDRGETSLLGGFRVPKYSRHIVAIGTIDELNASLGVLQTYCEDLQTGISTKKILIQIQHDLFNIGAELATSAAARISDKNIMYLEQNIDALEVKLPKLKNFIIPGGTPFAARIHLSRAICRRAERVVVRLHIKEPIRPAILIYLNRLSDLLFMLARKDMFDKREKEQIWPA